MSRKRSQINRFKTTDLNSLCWRHLMPHPRFEQTSKNDILQPHLSSSGECWFKAHFGGVKCGMY